MFWGKREVTVLENNQSRRKTRDTIGTTGKISRKERGTEGKDVGLVIPREERKEKGVNKGWEVLAGSA